MFKKGTVVLQTVPCWLTNKNSFCLQIFKSCKVEVSKLITKDNQAVLIDLGNGVEEKTGRINLENKLNFESFKIIEAETTKIKKLTEKLNKLSQK